MKKDIGKALEANAKKVEHPPAVQVKKEINLNKDAEEDYNLARTTLHDIISKSGGALDDMIALAAEAEHPRAYEVLANLMKSTADVADQLIKLQKQRHELDELNNPGAKQQVPMGGVTNNNLFVGSTTELQKLIAKGKMVNDKDIIDVTDE